MATNESKIPPQGAARYPDDLGANAAKDVSGALTTLLADMFALYLKTKNFHWHVSGPHFRDYHLFLDDQATQIFAMTDAIAERARKVGGMTLRSIGHIARLQRVADNDADYVTPLDMLAELRDDNMELVGRYARDARALRRAQRRGHASLIENWIDEAESRVWFLFEAMPARGGRLSGSARAVARHSQPPRAIVRDVEPARGRPAERRRPVPGCRGSAGRRRYRQPLDGRMGSCRPRPYG